MTSGRLSDVGRGRWFETGIDLLVLSAVFAAAVVLVNPNGDFPLNDDWSYGLTVKRLVEEGTFDPIGWQAMSLLSQVLWGALFSVLFGFSFTVLRFSTLALSLVGAFAVYFLTREVGGPLGGQRRAALLAALTLVCNPIYLALSNTFMSDVPFAAFVALSMLFLLRSLKDDSRRSLLWGTLAAILAVLCRQNGLFVPIAFGIAYVLRYGFQLRRLFVAGFPSALALAALLVYQGWLEMMGRMPVEYGAASRLSFLEMLDPLRLVVLGLTGATYLGLFMLPVLLGSFLSTAEGERRWGRFGLVAGSLLVLLVMAFPEVSPLPRLGNILVAEGIGPLSLRDTYLLSLPNVPALPAGIWTIIRVMGLIGGVILIAHALSIVRGLVSGFAGSQVDRTGVLFCMVAAAVCLLPLVFAEAVHDRYLIPVMLVLAPALLSSKDQVTIRVPRALRMGTLGLLLASFFTFSVLATHDYLAWNRTRWMAVGDVLENGGVSVSQIDGGFEVNGYYLYAEDYRAAEDGSRSWWWVEGDFYLVSFGDVPGYRVERRYEFDRWLPPGTGRISLLRRINDPER